ncbi:MAG TPA: hypothetical protein VHZ78_08630 [Rhizomicrobium sp.]|jgi:hypothetical protein|nr:hypothetical protein [Rhizomicrobium sp.]
MGRPSFSPSPEQCSQVVAWIQVPVAIEEMARRIGVTSKTFRKAFAPQLAAKSGETVNTEPKPPPYQPTPDERLAVRIMAATHGAEEDIASSIGITVDQLNASFAKELQDGPAFGYREGVESLFNSMKAGNVTAAKAWLILNMQGDRTTAKAVEMQPASNGLRGKKEQASAAAHEAVRGGGRFAPPAPPKLIVNNDS